MGAPHTADQTQRVAAHCDITIAPYSTVRLTQTRFAGNATWPRPSVAMVEGVRGHCSPPRTWVRIANSFIQHSSRNCFARTGGPSDAAL
eukprot:146959-Prymnesium_polylepis.2